MVRLKTDRWYSSRGQEKSRRVAQVQSLGTRRVVSLCLLLGLVIVLMQKAADPRYVSSAFRQLGVPLEGELQPDALKPPAVDAATSGVGGNQLGEVAAQTAGGAEVDPSETSLQTTGSQVWDSTQKDLTKRIFALASESERDALSQIAFADPSQDRGAAAQVYASELAELSAKSTEQVDAVRKQLIKTPPAEVDLWVQSVDRFAGQWNELLDSGDSTGLEFSLWRELRQVAYRHLVSKFVDSTIWKKSEQFAFKSLIRELPRIVHSKTASADSGQATGGKPPEVVTRQMLAEPDLLRGNVVRFTGEMRRVDNHRFGGESSPDQGELGQYWLLWLRGDDDANQPVAVYASTLALDSETLVSIKQAVPSKLIETDEAIAVDVTGVFVKQLAYAGSAGMQVAPVLLAGDVRLAKSAPNVSNALVADSADLWRQVLYAFAIALVICLGVVFAVLPGFKKTRRVRSLMPGRLPPKRLPEGESKGGTSRVLLPWLFWLALGSSSLAQNSSLAQGVAPPWATDSAAASIKEQAAVDYITDRLDDFWDRDTLQAVNAHATAANIASTPVPDGVLKIQQSLEKVGLRRLLSGLSKAPESTPFGLSLIRKSGYLVNVQKTLITRDQRNWFGNTKSATVYRLVIEGPGVDESRDDGGEVQQFVVYVDVLPEQLVASDAVCQPVAFEGVALDDCAASFSDRVSWTLKNRGSEIAGQGGRVLRPKLTPNQLTIGSAGWDLAYLDLVQRNAQKPISTDESECFFSFLRAAATYSASDLKLEFNRSPVELMKAARRNCGAPIQWVIRAVRGSAIDVPESVRQTVTGLPKRYYQIDGFVHLGNQKVSFSVPTPGGKDKIVFEREFPITIVTLDESLVPEEVLNGQSASWQVDRYLEATGAFYRLWEYHSDLVSSKNSEARQAAPLVAAASFLPTQLPVPQTGAEPIAWFGVAMCIAVLVILAGVLYLTLKRDISIRHSRSRTR